MRGTYSISTVFLFILSILCSIPCAGQDASAGERPAFLSAHDVDVSVLLASPPAPGSPAQQEDLAKVESWQTSRTKQDCARADRVAHVTLAAGFGSPDGPLTKAEVERWDSLFEEIKDGAELFIKEGKNHWKRPRPFVTEKAVHPCADRDGTKASFSYPSGHATLAELFARVLAELDPSRKKAFFARADQIAQDRVMAGVHYPTDILAGKKLGDAVFARLMKTPDFRHRLAQAALQ